MHFLWKNIVWDQNKNTLLKETRKIWFEDVVLALKTKKILAIKKHFNLERYPNQTLLIIEIHNYACIVPFIENEKEIFFKTIIPSRKFTKLYLNK